MESPVLIL